MILWEFWKRRKIKMLMIIKRFNKIFWATLKHRAMLSLDIVPYNDKMPSIPGQDGVWQYSCKWKEECPFLPLATYMATDTHWYVGHWDKDWSELDLMNTKMPGVNFWIELWKCSNAFAYKRYVTESVCIAVATSSWISDSSSARCSCLVVQVWHHKHCPAGQFSFYCLNTE